MSILSKQKILISACLLGKQVRYDGKIKRYNMSVLEKHYDFVSCCPEVDGGLSTPRAPSEISKDGKVINYDGIDVTKEFKKGSFSALKLVKEHDIKVAILKSNSPSCSSKMVYDGTFSGTLIEGVGITTKLLKQNGVKVFDEMEIEEALIF